MAITVKQDYLDREKTAPSDFLQKLADVEHMRKKLAKDKRMVIERGEGREGMYFDGKVLRVRWRIYKIGSNRSGSKNKLDLHVCVIYCAPRTE